MINIDIHTKRITSDTRIFVARPGAKYRFYELFVDRNFVGPDLPGLDLPEFDNLQDIEDLDARVKRSVAYRRYFLRGENDVQEPAIDIRNYLDAPDDQAFSQFIRVVRAYFDNMKVGDLVIVPPVNFRGQAQIGELTAGPSVVKTLGVAIYPGMPLTGRNVRWLASMEKAKLPSQTLDALQKPSPLFLLTRDAWAAVFRRAYGSYVTDVEYGSRFEITSERYQTVDDFNIQAFFNFVAANTDRVANGREDLLNFQRGAFSAQGVAPDLYTNVNSPGGLSLKSAVVTPIVIAVMLTLAVTVGPDAFAAAMEGTITFGNSQAPAGDACVAEVGSQVVTQLKLLGYDLWAEACQHARTAAANTGISTTVDIKN
ncbi:hypothetical protein HFO15_01715 [Rhizobium laguerreae]|uniref:hypothetical protein n=1 Tax=Rhizobium laguerreae TaxID=1076926 RepID=UPI001C92AB9D|nr:hypothetical protein [Rhizobium laguerreae]MBY3260384.1 hypothetical protein [Rhizobium laguerreae]MBY3335692.1 hypothetical protein [Rhizobium laguerreae]